MAREGEGDDRWIVNDLGDEGRNVDQWHWEESNVMHWVKDKINAAFENQEISNGECKIKLGVHHIKGEAVVNNRKGHLRSFYELDISLKYKGTFNFGEKISADGKINMPYIGEENDIDDFEINYTCENKTKDYEIKDWLKKHAEPFVKSKMCEFLKELRAGAYHVQRLEKLKSKKREKLESLQKPKEEIKIEKKEEEPVVKEEKKAGFTSLSITEKFKSPPNEIYECFLNEDRVKAYTQANAQISREEGGSFSIMNGLIVGKNQKLVPEKKIVQQWRMNEWEDGVYSNLEITLETVEGDTIVELKQTNIPEKDKNGNRVVDKLQALWRGQFLMRIRVMFDGKLF